MIIPVLDFGAAALVFGAFGLVLTHMARKILYVPFHAAHDFVRHSATVHCREVHGDFHAAGTGKARSGRYVGMGKYTQRRAFQLDPYRYLTWVFAEAPRLSHADPEWASKLLPWNAPTNCRPAK